VPSASPQALLSIGAAGLVVRSALGSELRYRGWELAAIFALFAMVRPPDAVTVGLGLSLALLAWRRSATRPVVVVHPSGKSLDGTARVVAGVIDSETSFHTLGFAFAEAAARRMPLFVIHCEDDADVDVMFDSRLPMLSNKILSYREQYPAVEVTCLLIPGEPAEALADFSRGADLLVVGSRGYGRISGLLLGSVSQSLLHHAHCPVAVMHGEYR
jgi:nucleotide-binding universal stress UspA family protein